MEGNKFCGFETESSNDSDTADTWQPPVQVKRSISPPPSSLKRSQSMRLSTCSDPKLKAKIEQRRKRLTLEDVETRPKLNEDFRINDTESMIKEGWFWKSKRSQMKQDDISQNKLSDLREESKSTQDLKEHKLGMENEKKQSLVNQGPIYKAWNPPDKVEDLPQGYRNIPSPNLKRSQSMLVSKRPQLKEEIEKQQKHVTVEEDEPRSSLYKGFSSVRSIPSKNSPREDEKGTKYKDVTVAWNPPDEVEDPSSGYIKSSNLKRSQSMRVSKRPQLKEEIEKQQRRCLTVEEDAPRSSLYKGFSSSVRSIPGKTSPREDEKGFIKSNTIAEESELSGLCIGEARELDIVDSAFGQRVEESQLIIEKPSIFKRSQSMRIPKSSKLKEGIEKQRKCVTLEEAETRHEDSERRVRIYPHSTVERTKPKLGYGTNKPGYRVIVNENDLTTQPKQQWQSLQPKVDRLENSLNLKSDIKEICDRNELSQPDDRTRPTFSRRMTTKTIYGHRNQETITADANINCDSDIVLHSKDQSANYQKTTTVCARTSNINSDGDIVLHSKGLGTNYKLSKTATVSRLKHSSVVPTDSPLSYHREIKASDDEFIRIWRFGQTSECITFSKEEKIDHAIFKISKKLKINASALDLFYRHSILVKTDTLDDHIEVGKKDRVYVIEKQLSRQVPYGFLTDAPDMIDPWEDEIPRVLMSCGHGITCDNLYEYCRRQIESGHAEFLCPSVSDLERPHEQCGSRWDFVEVRKKACLSDDESNMFEIMLSYNKIQQSKDIHQCPQCSKYIESVCCRRGFVLCKECDENYNFDFKFCVLCQRKWVNSDDSKNCGHVDCQTSLKRLQKILMTCQTKDIVGIQNCPTVRACPQCNYIVEHEGDNCKHMDCPSQYCRTKFCFVCLQIKTDKYYWPESCGGAFIHCQLAPRQTV